MHDTTIAIWDLDISRTEVLLGGYGFLLGQWLPALPPLPGGESVIENEKKRGRRRLPVTKKPAAKSRRAVKDDDDDDNGGDHGAGADGDADQDHNDDEEEEQDGGQADGEHAIVASGDGYNFIPSNTFNNLQHPP